MTNIIEILGEQLAKVLNVKPIQAKGLLRLSIKDVMPNKATDDLSFKDITLILKQSLNDRLNKIGVPNGNKVVQNLVQYITDNQSLMTLLRT